MKESLVDVGAAFVADTQATILVQPGNGSLEGGRR